MKPADQAVHFSFIFSSFGINFKEGMEERDTVPPSLTVGESQLWGEV